MAMTHSRLKGSMRKGRRIEKANTNDALYLEYRKHLIVQNTRNVSAL